MNFRTPIEHGSDLSLLEKSLPQTAQRLHSLIDLHLLEHGFQLCVQQNQRELVSFGMGIAREDRPVTPSTLFRRRCALKPLVTVATAVLVQSEHLSLDDRVQKYLPRFGQHGKEAISIRQIMNHTSGLHAYDVPVEMISGQDLMRGIEDGALPPGWVPGRSPKYSVVAGWQVLAAAIEAISGQELPQFLRAEVFAPLGLGDTWVGMTGDEFFINLPRLGSSYLEMKTGDLVEYPFDLTEEACTQRIPAACGYSTSHDMATFYSSLLLSKILNPPTLELVTHTSVSRVFGEGPSDSGCYGLGFMTNLRSHGFGDYCSPQSFGHSGSHGSTLAFADPKFGLAIAFHFNDVIEWWHSVLRRTSLINAIYNDLQLHDAAHKSEGSS